MVTMVRRTHAGLRAVNRFFTFTIIAPNPETRLIPQVQTPLLLEMR